MFRESGNGRINHSNGTGGAPMTRAHGGFGERNAHKSTKAIIGIAILIVLSIVFYELRSSRDAQISSASPALPQHSSALISQTPLS